MSAFWLLLGFVLGALSTVWLLAWLAEAQEPEPVPDNRQQVVARLLLHQTRRRRQLAELERDMVERGSERLRRLDHGDDPDAN